jgi:hypothetical protein
MCPYNMRSLGSQVRLVGLEKETEKFKWDVIGLCEVNRKGEECLTLQSGNVFYWKVNIR